MFAVLRELDAETYVALLSRNASPRCCARPASWRDRNRKNKQPGQTLHGDGIYVIIFWTSDDCDGQVDQINGIYSQKISWLDNRDTRFESHRTAGAQSISVMCTATEDTLKWVQHPARTTYDNISAINMIYARFSGSLSALHAHTFWDLPQSYVWVALIGQDSSTSLR